MLEKFHNIFDCLKPISMERKRSEELFTEAKNYFPGGVNSPVRAFKSVHGPPLFIKTGNGCYITDEDNHTYIDFCCSWGPLIHGHNNAYIKSKAIEAIENGTSFGTPNKLGNQLGKLIIDNHSYVDSIRFVSSGTEAVMSAIRLARGFTGRKKILKFEGCYHGHVDSLLVKAGSGLATFGVSTSAGIPAEIAGETLVVPLNDLGKLMETMEKHAEDLACIILEPIPANNGLLLQDTSFLVWLRQLCDKYNVLLIFDEVISGFRVGFEGAAGYYRIEPDLLTFGKIIGGGFPVGAFGGKKEIMSHVAPEGNVYQAGTLSANPVAMAAGQASLSLLLQEGFYDSLEQKTQGFVNRIQAYADEKSYKVNIVSIGSIFWIAFNDERIWSSDQIDALSMDKFKVLHKELLDRGVYLGPSGYEVGFISSAHTSEALDAAAQKMCDSLDVVFK